MTGHRSLAEEEQKERERDREKGEKGADGRIERKEDRDSGDWRSGERDGREQQGRTNVPEGTAKREDKWEG